MTGLGILILIFWLGWELSQHDTEQPEPPDPYRWDKWNEG